MEKNQECGYPSITERRYAHLSLDQLDALRERLDKEFDQVDNLRRFIMEVCRKVENTPYFPSGHKWDCKREKVRYSIQAVYEDLVDLLRLHGLTASMVLPNLSYRANWRSYDAMNDITNIAVNRLYHAYVR